MATCSLGTRIVIACQEEHGSKSHAHSLCTLPGKKCEISRVGSRDKINNIHELKVIQLHVLVYHNAGILPCCSRGDAMVINFMNWSAGTCSFRSKDSENTRL